MKMTFLILASVVVVIIGLLGWASHPWSISERKVNLEVTHVEPDEMVDYEEHPSVIKVLTWNIGYLFGEGSEGPGYKPQDQKFYDEKLHQIVKEIKNWSPDVICLQEIDFGSSRSLNIDQALLIAQKAGYPYVARAVSWQANYIPFPHWPLTHHFGRLKSGGAILSRYPILSHEVTLLEKPLSQPWWYNLFYLHRYFQKVTIELGKKKYDFVNLHLEAFDKKDRESQVRKLVKKIEDEGIDIVAGDFNTVPLSAFKKSKFKNEDNYENDPSYELMLKTNLLEVIPEDIYTKEESRYFTFPTSRPDRRLDYIFYNQNLKMMRAEVLHSKVSDHLPIRASFQIDKPKYNPFTQ